MLYRRVKSLAQYKAYMSYLEKLNDKENKSENDNESIDLLHSLIKHWEAEHQMATVMIPASSPADPVIILDRLMTKNKLSPSILASALSISQSTITDILNYKQELSEDLISKISQWFKVSRDVFRKMPKTPVFTH